MKASAVLFLLLSLPAFADTARIATWNLVGFNQIPQENLNNIIEGLKKLDADILVLPELNPLPHGQAVADKLSEPADSCYKSIVPDQPIARQEIGFLHKCHVTVTSAGLVIGSDLSKRGYRNATASHVKIDEFDFVQGVLVAGEKGVLVIGDYNMIQGQDADNSLLYVSSEELVEQGSHISTNDIDNLLDGYAFINVDDPEYQEGSLQIVPMRDELGFTLSGYKEEVTDHLSLVAEFKRGVDGD